MSSIKNLSFSLKLIALLQVVMVLLVGSELIGYCFFPLRALFGFIYLTFIPGYLILHLLGNQKIGTAVSILFSAGLSLALLMFIGFSLNELFPLLGISEPISFLTLFITLSIIVVSLWILNYYKHRTCSDFIHIRLNDFLSPSNFFLLSIPLVSIFGIVLQVHYGFNIGLLVTVFLIAVTTILISTGRFIYEKSYPLAIVAIAVALLLQYPNMSTYITGYDIHTEFYYSNLVLENSYWVSTIQGNINGMLSIVMLSPIYSLVMGISNSLVFKIVYPLLFSLVPLGLFCIFRKISSAWFAFLSAFFFMSFPTFFTEMTSVMRQEIAELFFVLLILLIIEAGFKHRAKPLLAMVFITALITSHYGLSFIFLFFYLILGAVLLFLMKTTLFLHLRHTFQLKKQKEPLNSKDHSSGAVILNMPVILYSFIFAFFWYVYAADSSILRTVVHIVQNLWGSIGSFFDLTTRGFSAQRLFGGPSAAVASSLREVNQVIQYVTLFFIVIGVLTIIISRNRIKLNKELYVLTIVSVLILGVSVVLPNFSSTLNVTRIYHISLVFLSFSCVMGGIIFLEKFSTKLKFNTKHCTVILAVILVSYFIFNTGFIYEVAGDTPSTTSLSLQRLKASKGDFAVWFNSFYLWPQEVASATWLSQYKSSTAVIFADIHSKERTLLSYGMISPQESYYLSSNTEIPLFSYVYFSHLNIVNEVYTSYNQSTSRNAWDVFNISDISNSLHEGSLIYNNGESEIWIKIFR